MKTAGYLMAFAIAIWSLSAGYASLLQPWQAPQPAGIVMTLLYAVLFVAAFLYLGYWSYAAERAAGRVRRRIGLYEWFLRS